MAFVDADASHVLKKNRQINVAAPCLLKQCSTVSTSAATLLGTRWVSSSKELAFTGIFYQDIVGHFQLVRRPRTDFESLSCCFGGTKVPVRLLHILMVPIPSSSPSQPHLQKSLDCTCT